MLFTCSGKTKACGTGITPSVLLFHTLSLDSSQPLLPLAISPLPSCSQEDLKYQYPFLLDIAFSLQSAFCCPFIVKTSGEIPCRNILSNAALPASSGLGAALLWPVSGVYGQQHAHAVAQTCHGTRITLPSCQGYCASFAEAKKKKAQTINYILFHSSGRGIQYLGNWVIASKLLIHDSPFHFHIITYTPHAIHHP